MLIFFAALLAASIFLAGTNPISRAIRAGQRVNILLMGMDAVATAKHTDTLILMSFNPADRVVDLISIPRDTLIKIEGLRIQRINEIYAYYFKKSKSEKYAAEQLINYINTNLFEGKIDLRYYVQVDYDLFVKIVDLLGKIRVEITEPMKYDDFAGNLHINFPVGARYLDGKDALKYIRYRGKGSDIKRISRQQKFIAEWLKSIKKPLIVLRSPQLLKYVLQNLNTNIGLWGLANLAVEFRDFDQAKIRFSTIPGRISGYYWRSESAANFLEMLAGPREKTATPYLVDIWNASGYRGAAKKARDMLINSGFNVVEWGNYAVQQEKTIIKNMTNDVNPAVMIQSLIGGDIINKFEANRSVDLSVIIGKDFKDATGYEE